VDNNNIDQERLERLRRELGMAPAAQRAVPGVDSGLLQRLRDALQIKKPATQSEVGSMSPGGGAFEPLLRLGHSIGEGLSTGAGHLASGATRVFEDVAQPLNPKEALESGLWPDNIPLTPQMREALRGVETAPHRPSESVKKFFGKHTEQFSRTGLKPGLPRDVVVGASEALPTIAGAGAMGPGGLMTTGAVAGYGEDRLKGAASGAISGLMGEKIIQAAHLLPTALRPLANWVAGYSMSGGDPASGFVWSGLGMTGKANRYQGLREFFDGYKVRKSLKYKLTDQRASSFLYEIAELSGKKLTAEDIKKSGGPKKAFSSLLDAQDKLSQTIPGKPGMPENIGQKITETMKRVAPQTPTAAPPEAVAPRQKEMWPLEELSLAEKTKPPGQKTDLSKYPDPAKEVVSQISSLRELAGMKAEFLSEERASRIAAAMQAGKGKQGRERAIAERAMLGDEYGTIPFTELSSKRYPQNGGMPCATGRLQFSRTKRWGHGLVSASKRPSINWSVVRGFSRMKSIS